MGFFAILFPSFTNHGCGKRHRDVCAFRPCVRLCSRFLFLCKYPAAKYVTDTARELLRLRGEMCVHVYVCVCLVGKKNLLEDFWPRWRFACLCPLGACATTFFFSPSVDRWIGKSGSDTKKTAPSRCRRLGDDATGGDDGWMNGSHGSLRIHIVKLHLLSMQRRLRSTESSICNP